MSKANNLPPFAPVDLRVWIEGTKDDRDVIGAIRLIQWIEGLEEPIYLEQIVAACYPTSERQVQRALASCKEKNWVITRRASRGRVGRGAPIYELSIKPMSFKEARVILDQRANMTPRLEGTNTPNLTDQDAYLASSNIKEKDLQERPRQSKSRKEAKAFSPEIEAAVTEYKHQFQNHYKEDVWVTDKAKNLIAALYKEVPQVGEPVFWSEKVAGYFASRDGWPVEKRHPVWLLVSQFSSWPRTKPMDPAGPSKPEFVC